MKTYLAVAGRLMLAIALAAPACAQSLGDLAKKEKERREKIQADSKVITNDDTSKYAAGAVTTGAPAPAAAEQKSGDQPQGTPPATAQGPPLANPDEPTDLQGRPEGFWRQTFADARQKVKALENEANVLTLRINDLQNRFYNTDDGFQRQAVQRELQKTFYEQDMNRENLTKARAMLEDLEKEARKSGALPGWIEAPRTP